ncbi:MAG TPA: YdeI/OmpD-associated family protein, partial [Saprospiraceae bacterium]|nr:YdeI/OmpD-associated family protein [Saprospiraceae bacterium]
YIFEAVEVEKAGLKVQKSTAPELPKELLRKFGEMPAFREAFEALTPGRQRGYLLHFSQPKQSATRTTRIEKCLPKIFAGKGM